MEEDRDRLRKELHNVREKLHAENGLHSPVPFEESGVSDESAPVSFIFFLIIFNKTQIETHNLQEVFCEAISDEPI